MRVQGSIVLGRSEHRRPHRHSAHRGGRHRPDQRAVLRTGKSIRLGARLVGQSADLDLPHSRSKPLRTRVPNENDHAHRGRFALS